MRVLSAAFFAACVVIASVHVAAAQAFGSLSNRAEVFQPDPIQLPNLWQVKTGFTYTDPDGLEWTVYEGFLSDLASIPTIAQAIIGEKTEPKFLHAALVHDQFIACRTRSTVATNVVFYQLLKLADVDDWRAETMYNAVNDAVESWSVGDEPMALCPDDFLEQDPSALAVTREKASAKAQELTADIELIQTQRQQVFEELLAKRSQVAQAKSKYEGLAGEVAQTASDATDIEDTDAHMALVELVQSMSKTQSDFAQLSSEVEQLERVLRVESLLFIELSNQRNALLADE